MGTKYHRLRREFYQGSISVAFTLCVAGRKQLFTSAGIVGLFVPFLKEVVERHHFHAIYCFMPDHLHLISIGIDEKSDHLRGVEDFKQLSGYWLKSRLPLFQWQKSFYDRVLRQTELGTQVRYVIDNPVRKRLVREWRDYPFIGSIGLDLEEFLNDLAPD